MKQLIYNERKCFFVILSLTMYSEMNCCSTGIVGSYFQCPVDTSLKHTFSCLAWIHLCLSLTPSRFEWSLLACTVHLQRRKEWKPKDGLRTRAIFCSCSWRIKNHAHKAQQITNRLFFPLQFLCLCFHVPMRFLPRQISCLCALQNQPF